MIMTTSYPQLKPINCTYLYNMLQDFRHLLIFDFRETFQSLHIRDSFHVSPNLNRSDIVQIIQLAETKASQKEIKYKQIKRIRRYFFISDEQIKEGNKGVQFVLDCLKQRQSKDDKFYSLNESFETFISNYPFLLVDKLKLEEGLKKSKQQYERMLLYPYAKFACEIIPGRLYLGNVYCSNSLKQLEDLKIKAMVDFIYYEPGQKNAEFKDNFQFLIKFPIHKDIQVYIDFDFINRQIDRLIANNRVLLYCKDGESISPAFAISYLMFKANLSVQIATLKVCQAISRVNINKMVYTQLLVYKPKK